MDAKTEAGTSVPVYIRSYRNTGNARRNTVIKLVETPSWDSGVYVHVLKGCSSIEVHVCLDIAVAFRCLARSMRRHDRHERRIVCLPFGHIAVFT